MAVATDDPQWGRNRNLAHAPHDGDEAAAPRSAASDYARATMPNPPQMPRYAPPPPPQRETAAHRYGAAPRAPEPSYAPEYAQSYAPAPDYPAYPYDIPAASADVAPAAPPSVVRAMAQNVSRWTRYAGAAASVALVLGVAWWSYELLMRDMNGVPVVRAMEGPMRIAPENPGGEVSSDMGLAVNAIAAIGTAAPPEEELALAPLSSGLTEDDLSVAVQAPEDGTAVAAEAVEEADFSAFAAQPAPVTADVAADVTAAVQPAPEVAQTPVVEEIAPEEPALAPVEEVAADPAPVTAPRPPLRPANRSLPAPEAVAEVAAPAPGISGPLPSGTPLVQFGAYDSLELAGGEWERLQTRFSGLIEGKTRVVQEAASGGRTFFRLRATGFGDLAEARRFCSAMVAEGAECIPTLEP